MTESWDGKHEGNNWKVRAVKEMKNKQPVPSGCGRSLGRKAHFHFLPSYLLTLLSSSFPILLRNLSGGIVLPILLLVKTFASELITYNTKQLLTQVFVSSHSLT